MPLNDNLFALTVVVLADLQEAQGERFSSTMSLRGLTISDYTFDAVREVMIELFCAPKSSIDNPSLRTVHAVRSFCVLDDGELDGQTGYWVEDDETGDEGFLPEFDDVLWVYDDKADAWASHRFHGRRMRRGQPKGKGKGKGKKGRRRFKSRRGKGKGQSAHWGDGEWEENVAWSKGKGKQGKKGGDDSHEKGKGKGKKGKEGKSFAHVADDSQEVSLLS